MAFRGYGGGVGLSASERVPNSKRGQQGKNKDSFCSQMDGANKRAELAAKMRARNAAKRQQADQQ
ncbi:MAG: hypothetical protein Q4D06_05745 [Coriobacteriia bacterium]|nr:hypothetical protein [Coriobacteriia bacterium]